MVMEVQPQLYVRPPRTRAHLPKVITSRGRIIGYHEAGKGIREISRLLVISRDTIRLWVRRYEEEGHVLTRPRPGRPRVTTPAADQQIQRAAERAPLSTTMRIKRRTGVQCHPTTTRRRIRETGRQCFIPARKETLTEAHREARKMFPEAYADSRRLEEFVHARSQQVERDWSDHITWPQGATLPPSLPPASLN
ncbi:putative helix-turn-helix domain containing protein 2 [Homarus americanus]|uniref:Putative helix-turn-helix domain containing protein 2 n=1 Tax=Homarus americanus TaxID=6706 RepID=A0A8J5MVE1_HOMAM|nr:putative helix-turn-helix domain containing protein 2 [Homarus americanus]